MAERALLNYCPKCGQRELVYVSEIKFCRICKTKLKPIPEKFLDRELWLKKGMKEQFIEECVKPSPEFDPDLFERADELALEADRELEQAAMAGRAIMEGKNGGIKCMYCGSSNIRKIGAFSRSISASIWGLGSKKIGKQWHCNNCGSDF